MKKNCKNSYKIIGLFILFCITINVKAQYGYTQPYIIWDTIHDSRDSILFSVPASPVQYDTLHVRMYVSVVDSLLGMQVHIFDSAYINTADPLIDSALSQSGNDTMAAIAKIFLLSTNSNAVEYIDTTINGCRSIDIGLDYQTLATNTPTYTFVRYYLWRSRFYTFSISGASSDLSRLTSYRETFFNSINFQ
jgi:hypothetical protein